MNELQHLAELLRQRNAIDEEIARVVGRPVTAGHLGEFVAAQIFNIELESSAVTKAIDGRFTDGTLAGQTVNIKYMGKLEGLLDVAVDGMPEYYLVLTGPRSAAASSRGTTRPWCISGVYLFRHLELVAGLTGLKLGIATSVRRALWDSAEIYPEAHNHELVLTETQKYMVALFA